LITTTSKWATTTSVENSIKTIGKLSLPLESKPYSRTNLHHHSSILIHVIKM